MNISKKNTGNFEPLKPGVTISINNLDKSFGQNHVLRNFNFDFPEGKSVAVLGKSGSGKSVLIKCIIGLMTPDSGSINVRGHKISELKREELNAVRRETGFLFQGNALYDSMTVRENLEFPLRRHRTKNTAGEINHLVREALENVGLPGTEDMMPSELSGGMKKRIALARTLILKPKIILYDEPTTGLDPITAKEISLLIVEIRKKYQTTSLIISHDLRCIRTTADVVIMLIDGSCYATGTFDDLRQSTDPKIKPFFD